MSDAGTQTTQTTQTTTGPAVGSFAADPEFAKFTEEERGFFALKGWDKKPATTAARELAQSYRELEKFTGVPKDQILRFPKDANDVENWNILRERMGVPKDVKDYDFTAVKFGDGSDLDEPFVEMMRKAALDNGIPKDAALELTKRFVQFMDDTDKADAVTSQAATAREFDDLKKSWGTNFESNTFIANQAAEKIGLTKDFIENAIRGGASRLQLSQGFLKLGVAMGEDKFVRNPSDQTNALTVESAKAQLDALQNDTAWTARLSNGDARAMEQFHALTSIMARRAA